MWFRRAFVLQVRTTSGEPGQQGILAGVIRAVPQGYASSPSDFLAVTQFDEWFRKFSTSSIGTLSHIQYDYNLALEVGV